MASNPSVDVYKFICDKIDSVPHLEALVLIFNSRPVGWTCEELASRLYISHEQVGHLLRDLVRMEFVAESGSSPVKYSYLPSSEERNLLMFSIDEAYRQDLVGISTMIHSKASPGVREFARAFRFRQEKK